MHQLNSTNALRCSDVNGSSSAWHQTCFENGADAIATFWELRENHSFATDAFYVLAFAALVGVIRYLCSHLVLDRMSDYILQGEALEKKKKDLEERKKNDDKKKPTEADEVVARKEKRRLENRRQKIKESGWYCLYYPISFAMGVTVYYFQSWPMLPTTNFWVDWPFQHVSWDLKTFYLFECGFYVQALLQLCFFELRRSDFLEFMLHHAATILLIGSSFYALYLRVGLVILFLHDFADIFLYTAKTLHYFHRDTATNVVFVLFAIAFFASRLVCFPFVVIRSTYFEHYYDLPYHYFTNFFLIVLLFLHMFWFYLISRMIVRAITVKTVEKDIRSDDEY